MPHITHPGLGTALGLNLDTFGVALRRVAHSVFLGAGSLWILTLVTALTAVLVLYVHQYAGAPVFLLGVLGFVFLWVPFVERRTILDHAGHIAVLTEVIYTGRIGSGLFARGQELVKARVGDPEEARVALIGVRNTSRRLMRHFDWLQRELPIDIGPLRAVLAWFSKVTSRFMGDVILSYLIVAPPGSEDPAQDAICYYVQNATALTKTALRTAWLQALLGALAWLFWLAALGGLAWLASTFVSPSLLGRVDIPAEHARTALIAAHITWVLVIGLPLAWLATWLARESLTRPVLSTIMLIHFHALIAGTTIDPAVRQRVAGLGDALRELESIQWRVQGRSA